MTIGIIGYGRFGRILATILNPGYDLKIYDPFSSDIPDKYRCSQLSDVCSQPLVFIAVPIRDFLNVIKDIRSHIGKRTTVIDVCSVKKYPSEIMETNLPSYAGIICSHPMFGPDSYSQYREQKMVMHPLRDIYFRYESLKDYFKSHSIRIVEMTPEEHDRQAAVSQGITHFIGRVLEKADVKSTEINTLGFTDLLAVIEQTGNDSLELFKDLQRFNPYTNKTILQLEDAIRHIHSSFNSPENQDEN